MTRKTFRRIARGCVGHPGTFPLIALCAVSGASLADHGLRGVLIGVAAMAVWMVPIYLIGAYERGRE